MNDAANHGIYDISTIAKYDPDIMPVSTRRKVELSDECQ
ncbi:hypothetical protein JQ634_16635 [Bradyrhizobium sp. AUGA SZCCT0240]|nr:hypothetical protein [Bradyrhizobium sp. AUGA SZCCT0160]MBR1198027.1 hypothetical protein [Bradyrhizobium sp. AUGA SZCCT0158]MBR1239035.1 hypothetical protein [Bradyrhizobium sp. AUGA SZCCT0274]MBR1247723.1 hypothetical protein [Bradyrhizobium sp. AUGA SZCCT0169]MBR1255323.1 hypothetical protein [Bradyrhizobium sp. AUGA SZCCT0240]